MHAAASRGPQGQKRNPAAAARRRANTPRSTNSPRSTAKISFAAAAGSAECVATPRLSPWCRQRAGTRGKSGANAAQPARTTTTALAASLPASAHHRGTVGQSWASTHGHQVYITGTLLKTRRSPRGRAEKRGKAAPATMQEGPATADDSLTFGVSHTAVSPHTQTPLSQYFRVVISNSYQ